MLDFISFSSGPAAGSAGAAGATGYSPPLSGRVLAVQVEFVGSPPASTCTALSAEGDLQGEAILWLEGANQDARLYPRRPVQDSGGQNLSFDGCNPLCTPYLVHGQLRGAIANANPGDEAVFKVWLEV